MQTIAVGTKVSVKFAGKLRIGMVKRDLRQSHPRSGLSLIVDFSDDLRCIGFEPHELKVARGR